MVARQIIAPHGLSATDAAAKFYVTRQAMSNRLGGRAGLSAEMAIRFKKAFGFSADTLIRMQAAHDLAVVRARAGDIEVGAGGGINLISCFTLQNIMKRFRVA